MNNLKMKIKMLKKEFSDWPAAVFHQLTLNILQKSMAEASLLISNTVLTPHPIPMVNGLMIATMASMVGVYAVKTLIDDEYPLLVNIQGLKLYQPTVAGEKKLRIETHITNNRKARADTIIVAAEIKSESGQLKAKCVFYYRIIAKEVIEPKLKLLAVPSL